MSENERDYILYLEDILNAINKIESSAIQTVEKRSNISSPVLPLVNP